MRSTGESAGEAWFKDAMAQDVVYRLTGQAITTWVQGTGYRDTLTYCYPAPRFDTDMRFG